MMFYIRTLPTILLEEYFRSGSIIEKISGNYPLSPLHYYNCAAKILKFLFGRAIVSMCDRLSTNYYY
jgi:hypothetical protein